MKDGLLRFEFKCCLYCFQAALLSKIYSVLGFKIIKNLPE